MMKYNVELEIKKTGFRTIIAGLLLLILAIFYVTGCNEDTTGAENQTEQPGTAVTPETETTANIEPVIIQGPSIQFENLHYDFGDVGTSTSGVATYNFKNVGNEVLIISKIEQCCGAISKLKDDKLEYQPGESGIVEVSLNFGTTATEFARDVTVKTNDPNNFAVTISFKANIIEMVSSEPRKLKFYIKQDNAGCPPIELTSVDDEPFAIKSFYSTANVVSIDFDPNTKATKWVINPVVDMKLLKRHMQGRVMFELTHSKCDTIIIEFDLLPQYRLEPPTIGLWNMEANEPIYRDVWIVSNFGEDFAIDTISCKNKYMKVLKQEKDADRINMHIEIIPPEDTKNSVMIDELVFKMKDGEELTLSCRGFY